MNNPKEHRRWDFNYPEKRILDALSIITIGVVLLLNTTGVLPWGIWINFLKLWPLIFISIGISFIFSWSRLSRFIGGCITLLIFLGALFVSIFPQQLNVNFNIFNLESENKNLVEKTQVIEVDEEDVENVDELNLSIDMSLGSLILTEDEDVAYLQVDSEYSTSLGEPEIISEVLENALNVQFKNPQRSTFVLGNNHAEHKFTLGTDELNRHLVIKLGAGNGVVQLEESYLESLSAEVGAGNLELTLAEDVLPLEEEIDLKVGLGNLSLKLPSSVGFKINYKVGLGSLEVNGRDVEGAWNEDGTFESENFDDAEKTVVINIDVGLGNVDISN